MSSEITAFRLRPRPALVRHGLDVSRELGLYCCYVATYAGDAGTVGFCLHCGFVPIATLPDVHGPGDEG